MSHGGLVVGKGYAGGNIPPRHDASAVNNPARQAEVCVGPLPRGRYTIGAAYTHPHLGFCMQLFRFPDNEMFGRDGFFLHADNPHHVGQSSEGCPVFSMVVLRIIAASSDRVLDVIE